MSGVNWTESELAARRISEPAQIVKPTLRTHNLTAHQRATGRIRQPKGMNKTEARYGAHLEARKAMGVIAWYRFEGITLKLAQDTRYTPDYFLMMADGSLQAHEVKGFWRDDAKVKLKTAAEQYPFEFVAVFAEKGGGWRYEHF